MKNTLIIALVLSSLFSFAQNIPEDVKPPSWHLNNLTDVTPFKLAPFNLKSLQDEDVINDKDQSKPWRFGYDIYVDHNFNDVGEWTTLDNGDRIWRMSYKSNNAYTLNFMFDVFKIPVGAKLYVYNNEKTDLLRPFTHHNNNDEEILGTWLVEGDHAWIEYYEPANVKEEARIVVGSVVHGYRTAETYQKGLNDSGACNQDVDCDITPSGADPYNLNTVKENVKSANAMMVTGSNGFCSGTLINNTNNDGTPYFMTANHCGGGEAGWAFRFNWRSPNISCSTTVNSTNGPFNQTVSGAILRASSSESDMELVEITDTSFFTNNPDLVWVGWNRSTTELPVVNFGIHHPNGDIQKTCRDDQGATRTVSPFNGNPNAKMWLIADWDLGVTSQGSSGSALYNQKGELIGVLSGGGAQCSGTVDNGLSDIYGRFDVAWDFGSSASSRLKEWLDPSNSGVSDLGQFPSLQTFDNDASLGLDAGSDNLCFTSFTPNITLTNRGDVTLTSADITFNLDGGTATTFNWTGALASNDSEIVASPEYNNLSEGGHTFTITVSNPNGVPDENPSNDNFTFNFEVSPSYTTTEIVFNLTTDNYGTETSWEVLDSANNIVGSGPTVPYQNNTTYQEVVALSILDECYSFVIFDSYGDGICCSFGNGSYSVEDENGNTIISGGNFGSQEGVTFVAKDILSTNTFDLENSINIYPNPVENLLHIEFYNNNDSGDYQIYNALGQQMSRGRFEAHAAATINMAEYQSGIYFIKFTNKTSSYTTKILKK